MGVTFSHFWCQLGVFFLGEKTLFFLGMVLLWESVARRLGWQSPFAFFGQFGGKKIDWFLRT